MIVGVVSSGTEMEYQHQYVVRIQLPLDWYLVLDLLDPRTWVLTTKQIIPLYLHLLAPDKITKSLSDAVTKLLVL